MGGDYVASLGGAHEHEHRVSFKDPGTQFYGADSPLFLVLLERLSNAFDGIQPPKPSLYVEAQQRSAVDMRRQYNTNRPTCFAGAARVLLFSAPTAADAAAPKVGTSSSSLSCAIGDLSAGAVVQTLRGPRAVHHVLRCLTDRNIGRDIVRLRVPSAAADLLVTLWHPVSLDGGHTWVFPAEHVAGESKVFFEDVYNLQLERDDEDDGSGNDETDDARCRHRAGAHVVNVDGIWATTMGHGLVEKGEEARRRDIRNHRFYGDFDAVSASIAGLLCDADGMAVVADVTRDEKDLMSGFVGVSSSDAAVLEKKRPLSRH